MSAPVVRVDSRQSTVDSQQSAVNCQLSTVDCELRTDVLDRVLDMAHPPVARFRLCSHGLNPNNTLTAERDLAGSRACLACGNCLDACPAVASRPPEQIVTRTSMVLEHVVGAECRRCYRCIAACPVVDADLKRYARAYRRPERVVHLLLASAVVLLGLSGILLFHFRAELDTLVALSLGLVHRGAALLLVAAPLLYWRLDRRHLRRALRQSLTWGAEDRRWLGELLAFLRTGGRTGAARRGDFNPAQKGWYLFILGVLPVLALSGIPKWLDAPPLPAPALELATGVHVVVAIMADVALALHVSLKVLWPVWRWLRSEVGGLGAAPPR
ncbi:MAG: cytochrome b/b6 domain-containing protein [Chloroflexi bacterium]|nr:cytochrome b/b6 domain-containing protein [Chloroflexota bacterium]